MSQNFPGQPTAQVQGVSRQHGFNIKPGTSVASNGFDYLSALTDCQIAMVREPYMLRRLGMSKVTRFRF